MPISLYRVLNGNIEIKSRVPISNLSLTLADHPFYADDWSIRSLGVGCTVLVYKDLQDVWTLPKDYLELLNRRNWVYGTRVPHNFTSFGELKGIKIYD